MTYLYSFFDKLMLFIKDSVINCLKYCGRDHGQQLQPLLAGIREGSSTVSTAKEQLVTIPSEKPNPPEVKIKTTVQKEKREVKHYQGPQDPP